MTLNNAALSKLHPFQQLLCFSYRVRLEAALLANCIVLRSSNVASIVDGNAVSHVALFVCYRRECKKCMHRVAHKMANSCHFGHCWFPASLESNVT